MRSVANVGRGDLIVVGGFDVRIKIIFVYIELHWSAGGPLGGAHFHPVGYCGC